jgi:hypothetical protein
MIRPDETLIQGKWLSSASGLVADDNCRRIEELTHGVLKEIASADGGWLTLYQDPSDRRLWERTYPMSETHGGGPPVLRSISRDEAQRKYGAFRIRAV